MEDKHVVTLAAGAAEADEALRLPLRAPGSSTGVVEQRLGAWRRPAAPQATTADEGKGARAHVAQAAKSRAAAKEGVMITGSVVEDMAPSPAHGGRESGDSRTGGDGRVSVGKGPRCRPRTADGRVAAGRRDGSSPGGYGGTACCRGGEKGAGGECNSEGMAGADTKAQ